VFILFSSGDTNGVEKLLLTDERGGVLYQTKANAFNVAVDRNCDNIALIGAWTRNMLEITIWHPRSGKEDRIDVSTSGASKALYRLLER
jgi:hypothetical protein